jgi:hypothetical protein
VFSCDYSYIFRQKKLSQKFLILLQLALLILGTGENDAMAIDISPIAALFK